MLNEEDRESCYKVTIKVDAPGKWLRTGYNEYLPCTDGVFYVVTKDLAPLMQDLKEHILSIELVGIGYKL